VATSVRFQGAIIVCFPLFNEEEICTEMKERINLIKVT
jgi:hypothetical protein